MCSRPIANDVLAAEANNVHILGGSSIISSWNLHSSPEIHTVVTLGLRMRPGTLATDVILYVKHSSFASLTLSDIIVMGVHRLEAESVMSKVPL